MYKPFPIYDFRSGLQFDREPWLVPHQAFQISDNIYFQNGRIYKRRGYAPFGNGCTPALQVAASTDDVDKRNTVFDTNRLALFAGKAGATCHAALRFDNVYIPQGTTKETRVLTCRDQCHCEFHIPNQRNEPKGIRSPTYRLHTGIYEETSGLN